jgi:long-chain fatty acid transport protein
VSSALHTRYELNIAFNSAAIVPGTPDAKVKLENASGWGYQPFVGLTWQMIGDALLGVVYRAKSDIDLDGDVNIRNWTLPIAAPGLSEVEFSWDNPQWLDLGLSYRLDPRNRLFLNGGWQDWSEFSDNGIAVSSDRVSIDTDIDRQWQDTWYARIGFAHQLDGQRAYTLGVSYDSSPVTDRNRTFDLPVES